MSQYGGYYAVSCPAGKIINPDSGRCIAENGAIALKLYKEGKVTRVCADGKVLRPDGRCVLPKGKKFKALLEKGQVSCPPGKVYKIETKRCVIDKSNQQKYPEQRLKDLHVQNKCNSPGKLYYPPSKKCVSAYNTELRKFYRANDLPLPCATGSTWNSATRRCNKNKK